MALAAKEFEIDSLEVDVDLGPSIVECLLHCIFFVRAFGGVQAVDCEIEALDGVAYARVSDDALDQLIKTKTRQFLDLQIAGRSNGEVVVSFFDKKLVKPYWFGTKQEENVCWERWILRFHFTGMGVKTADATLSPQEKASLSEAVLRRVHYILKVVNTQQEHIPVITKQDVLPFPYAIDVPQVTVGSAASLWENLFPLGGRK